MYYSITFNEQAPYYEHLIRGEKLYSFLNLCFSESDVFTLSSYSEEEGTCTLLYNDLKKYKIATIETLKWFGYDYTHAPAKELRVIMHENFYPTRTELIPIITNRITEIFFDRGLTPVPYDRLQNVEDICFFKEGKMIMGSISHECMLFMDSEVFPLDILSQYGRWKYENTFFPEIPEIKNLII